MEKEILIKLDFDVKDFSKASAELTKEINRLNEEQKQLKKTGQENSLQFQKNKEDLTQLKREYSENQRIIQNVTKANIENKGSNEQLKATLSVLTKQYNLLSKEERENINIGGKLKDQIKGVSDELKANESAIGNNTRNVGNYKDALGSAGQGLSSFGGAAGQAGAAAQSLGTKLLALLANPIVAIVAGITAAFMALRKAFMASEENEDKLAKVTQIFSTIMGKLFDIIKPLAEFIFDVVIKAFKDLAAAAEFTIGIVEKGLSVLGFEDAAKGVANYTKELNTAARAATAIADARDKADDKEREAIVKNAKAEAEIAEARRVAADKENYTRAEREEAIKRAVKLEDEVAARQEQIAKLRFQALKTEAAQSSSNGEQLKTLAEAEAELFNIQRSRAEGQKTLLRELNKLQKEENSEAKERAAEQKERDKEIIEAQKEIAKAFEDRIKREIEAQNELDAIERSRIADSRERQLAELDYQFEQKQAKIIGDGEKQKQLEVELLAEQTRAKNELLQKFKEEDEAKAAQEREMELELQEILAQGELNSLIELEKAKADARISEIKRVAAVNEESSVETALKVAKVEKEKTDKIKGYEKQLTDIKKQENQARLQATLMIAEAVNSLALGSTKAAKGVALAQIAISTGKSIANIVEMATAAGSAAGTAAGVVTAGVGAAPAFTAMKSLTYLTALAQIMGNFAQAKQIMSGFADGGYTGYGGKYEPAGMAHRGEVVFNQRDVAMLGGARAVDRMRPTAKGYADGGIVANGMTSSINSSFSEEQRVLQIVQNMPNPVVVVQDINQVQGDVRKVQVIAEI